MEQEIYTHTDGGKEFRLTTDEEGTPWVGIEVTVGGRTSCVGMPLTWDILSNMSANIYVTVLERYKDEVYPIP